MSPEAGPQPLNDSYAVQGVKAEAGVVLQGLSDCMDAAIGQEGGSMNDDAVSDPGSPSVETLRREVHGLLLERQSHCVVDGVKRYGIFQDRARKFHYRFLTENGIVTANAVGAFREGRDGIYRAGNVSMIARQWVDSLVDNIESAQVTVDAQGTKVQLLRTEVERAQTRRDYVEAHAAAEEVAVNEELHILNVQGGAVVDDTVWEKLVGSVDAANVSHIAAQRAAVEATAAHALVEPELRMGIIRLEFLQGSMQQLKNKVPALTVKLEEELQLWCNILEDSLRFSGVQAASMEALTLQNAMPT